MTTQNNALPTARKPLDMRALLDNWAMLLAAVGIFVLCALLIDNFLSPLNMRGLGLAISTVGIAACTMLFCLASGHFAVFRLAAQLHHLRAQHHGHRR